MPILECAEASKEIKEGDEVEVDFDSGLIKDITTGKEYQSQPFPEFMQKIMECGGLIPYINSQKNS